VGSLTYDDYLGLPRLLELQNTRVGSEDSEVGVSEHFFIVIHQSTELLLKQLDKDLRLAAKCLHGRSEPASLTRAGVLIGRGTATFALLTEHLDLLGRHLPREDFSCIRTTFGSASGVQSSQFRQVSGLLGVRVAGDGELLSAFLTRVARDGLTAGALFAPSDGAAPPHREVADELLHLGNAYYQWLVAHLTLVSNMIGIERGTGGTSGVEFLTRRFELPFAALRDAATTARP
jgi:tryptophan 2,3-dioxygenase